MFYTSGLTAKETSGSEAVAILELTGAACTHLMVVNKGEEDGFIAIGPSPPSSDERWAFLPAAAGVILNGVSLSAPAKVWLRRAGSTDVTGVYCAAW